VTVRYPEIEVQLIGQDGNAFNLIGLVARALTRAKVPAEEIKKFKTEAMSDDYNHLLYTCMEWVTVS
jgi:hypothetical protein